MGKQVVRIHQVRTDGAANYNKEKTNMQGIITTWLETKGYGFVQSEGSEIFLHISNIEGQPQLGAEIEFEIGHPVSLGKKPQAVRARVVSIPERKDITGGAQ